MIDLNQATACTDEELAEVMNFKPWNEQQIQKGVAVRAALTAAIDCNSAITFDGEI